MNSIELRTPPRETPKRSRVFVVVSRQVVLDSRFSTVICAPVYYQHDALASQLSIGIEEGMKHESSIHCDELVSLPKSALTNFVGTRPPKKLLGLNQALAVALELV